MHGATNWRLARLKKALSSPVEERSVRLDARLGVRREILVGDAEDLRYAMVRYACQWLDEQGMLWRFYRTFRDGIIDDIHGEKAFRGTTAVRAPATQKLQQYRFPLICEHAMELLRLNGVSLPVQATVTLPLGQPLPVDLHEFWLCRQQ